MLPGSAEQVQEVVRLWRQLEPPWLARGAARGSAGALPGPRGRGRLADLVRRRRRQRAESQAPLTISDPDAMLNRVEAVIGFVDEALNGD